MKKIPGTWLGLELNIKIIDVFGDVCVELMQVPQGGQNFGTFLQSRPSENSSHRTIKKSPLFCYKRCVSIWVTLLVTLIQPQPWDTLGLCFTSLVLLELLQLLPKLSLGAARIQLCLPSSPWKSQIVWPFPNSMAKEIVYHDEIVSCHFLKISQSKSWSFCAKVQIGWQAVAWEQRSKLQHSNHAWQHMQNAPLRCFFSEYCRDANMCQVHHNMRVFCVHACLCKEVNLLCTDWTPVNAEPAKQLGYLQVSNPLQLFSSSEPSKSPSLSYSITKRHHFTKITSIPTLTHFHPWSSIPPIFHGESVISHTHTYILYNYIYIYMYTHTHIYIYICII